MLRILRLSIVLLLLSGMLAAQNSGKKRPIEGVWKIVEIVETGPGASSTSIPQPSLLIVTRRHYSFMRARGEKPRALYAAERPTDAEKLAAFNSFVANTGSYEVSGSTLTFHPIVSRNPNYMAGGFTTYRFRIAGNNLWLMEKSSDSSYRVGDKVLPSSAPASETTTKFVRIE